MIKSKPPLVIIMGVSGSGKTVVGKQLAHSLSVPFQDADDYHPQENIEKMSQGIALTDTDRQPWLAHLNERIVDCQQTGVVLACSALKEAYRKQLSYGLEQQLVWVYLKGDYSLIYQRMQARKNHFMAPAMLQSQLDTLEEPANALVLEITHSIDFLVKTIKSTIQ